ncbi:NAD(P)-dependent dehydrogenase, short-chain alcohol dehydrogenase family [Paenibacillus sp. 1_12]|uniref:SDR family NAD(P)-dependent oxidoreductase n=1 Tax=Paenibacillus sp. 1_12 TaxID=1566278 RepID=UPI0008E37347|nr:SDR family NAD(P)-dependent oxidoreductase [Paenibacillus sp. 1_12]SFM46260.1 NAD(P)-dependent dehydrogenase, short-chain alcohol dehydrogenase family [Paenibacillus sp. 1_12]
MTENVLITGAGRGLGFELSKIFHENQYRVFPLVRNQSSANKLSHDLKGCYPIVADVSFDESISLIKSYLQSRTHSIDIIINCAGISGQETKFNHVTTDEMKELFNVHCLGVLRTVQAAYDLLQNSANPRVINISSRLGSLGKVSSGDFTEGEFSYAYRVAKAAQNMLTVCMDQEMKSMGIHISAIHPGEIKTTMGSGDADLTPEEAANQLFFWIKKTSYNNSGTFTDPFKGKLPW